MAVWCGFVGVCDKCLNDPQYSSLEGTELIFRIKKALYFLWSGSLGKMSQKRALESIDEEDESIGPMPDETALRKKPKGGSYIVCK